MEKALLNATQEERFEMSLKLHTTLAKLLAHQNGIENHSISLNYKGKENGKC